MKKKFIPLAIFLVIIMFFAVDYIKDKEIIFPEIAALATGAWVLEQYPWGTSAFELWFSPTLAALTGVLILKIFPYSPVLMIVGAFILVIMQLKLARSNVLPSVSAAILPIITQVHSWYYPLSVGIFTGLIALGRVLILHATSQKQSLEMPEIRVHELSDGLFYWGKLLLGIMIITVAALQFNLLYMVAPPLIVTFMELSNPYHRLRRRLGGILTELVFSAWIGVLSLYYLHYSLHLPIWFSSGLALAGLFVVYSVLKLSFPPAAAVCLLPTILPVERLWVYSWQVILGTVGFMVMDVLWFKAK